MQLEGKIPYVDISFNMSGITLAIHEALQNPLPTNLNSAQQDTLNFAIDILDDASNSTSFHQFEGDQSKLDKNNASYNTALTGAYNMLRWLGKGYDSDFMPEVDKRDDSAFKALAIMNRRDDIAQSVNRNGGEASSYLNKQTGNLEFGKEIDYTQIEIDPKTGDMVEDEYGNPKFAERQLTFREIVDRYKEASSRVSKEELEFFQFNNFAEMVKYFGEFTKFTKHPEVSHLVSNYAIYLQSQDKKRIEGRGQVFDETRFTIDSYVKDGLGGLLSYTMLCRAVDRNDATFKAATLHKLGMEGENLINLQVPKKVDNNFYQENIIDPSNYGRMIRLMINHTSHWNKWYK